MIPSSALLRDSTKFSQTVITTVDILRGNAVAYRDIPVTAAKITQDRSQKIRMNADITVSLANRPDIVIKQEIHRFRISRGYISLGAKETIQHGIFRIDDITENEDLTLEISGSGLEAYIVDARFLRPRTPPYGQSTIEAITELIQEVLPAAVVSVENTRDKPVQATAPWDKERWDAVDALAASIDAEVFVDYRGFFVIRDIPSLSSGTTAYTLTTGEAGTIIERKVKHTRDRVYNAAVCMGQSSDPNVPPVWGWAYDDDPTSLTYFYGDYGQVPRFQSSQFFTSNAQCAARARDQLAEALAANKALSVIALPLTFLEPGDIIAIELRDGTFDRRLLQKISFDAAVDARVSIDTLLMKDSDTGA